MLIGATANQSMIMDTIYSYVDVYKQHKIRALMMGHSRCVIQDSMPERTNIQFQDDRNLVSDQAT